MRFFKTLCTATLMICVAGCAEDEGDVDTASEGWRAANVALAGGQQQFEQEIEVGAEGEVTASCPEGGSVRVEGRMQDEHDFSLSLAFDDCQANGVTVDGELAFLASVMATETSAEVRFEYVGHLDFSGTLDASCEVDATGYVATRTDGTESRAEAQFEGHICGVSADAVIGASS